MFEYLILFSAVSTVCYLNALYCRPQVVKSQQSKVSGQVYYLDTFCDSSQVINCSSYLFSFSYNKPLTLRALLVSLTFSKFANKPLLKILLLIVIGGFPLLGHIKIADQPIDVLLLIERFLKIFSIRIYAAIADAVHHLIKPKEGENDAILNLRKSIKCEPSIPHYYPLESFPKALEGYSEELIYQQPKPILPDLFPGLCVGWGGLSPLQSEKTAARNALVAEILNRLSANLLVYSDILDASDLFLLGWDHHHPIRSVKEFVEKIPGLSLFFCKNSSSFGFMLCVKDDASKQGLNDYQQIPLAWPARTSIRDPDCGEEISMLSYHSSLVMTGSARECPLGEFRVQFFLGPDGVTSWKAGNEYLKPWAPLIATPPLSSREAILAAKISSGVACAVNLASKTQRLAVGGYALHGTCLDTVAIVKMCIYGVVDDFPLIGTGDARAGTAAACYHLIRELNRGESADWAKGVFAIIAEAVKKLPDDSAVSPEVILPTIERFQSSILGDFVHNQVLKNELLKIRSKWLRILPKHEN